MAITTGSGARVFIGTTALQTTQLGYEGDTWVEVGQVEEIGEFGDQANDVTANVLSNRRTLHLKGNFDAGMFPITCLHDNPDAGQQAMIAARAQDFNYNFQVQVDDPQAAAGSGTIYYFHGLVMSERVNVGNSDNVVRITFNVGINSDILTVDSTAS